MDPRSWRSSGHRAPSNLLDFSRHLRRRRHGTASSSPARRGATGQPPPLAVSISCVAGESRARPERRDAPASPAAGPLPLSVNGTRSGSRRPEAAPFAASSPRRPQLLPGWAWKGGGEICWAVDGPCGTYQILGQAQLLERLGRSLRLLMRLG